MPSGRIRKDVVGLRFGSLLILADAPDRVSGKYADRRVVVRCDCGTETTMRLYGITQGRVDCGCGPRKAASERMKLWRKRIASRKTHGHSGTPTYGSWLSMRARCRHVPGTLRDKYYHDVFVCPEWQDDFAAFLRDMGPRPQGKTLDRIDPYGNYEPGNCRWATMQEQRANRRSTQKATIG